MNVREAKDFLVNQTAQQADIDGVSLSDLEKRMMYFSESDPTCEDPIALNNEFEAEYDETDYEPKIKRLLRHAHKRVKTESPDLLRQWNDAMRELRKGDHYLLVLWGSDFEIARTANDSDRPPYDQLKLFAWAIVGACLLVAIVVVLNHFGIQFNRRPRDGRGFTGVQTSPPSWLKWPVLLLMAAGYFYAVIWPFIVKRSPNLIGWMTRKSSASSANDRNVRR